MLPDRRPSLRPRFTLRTAFFWLAIAALLAGWIASARRMQTRYVALLQQLMAARSQVSLAESRAELQADLQEVNGKRVKRDRPRAQLERATLRGVVIRAGDGAFQLAYFDDADLSGGSLTAGAASFQGASFNRAKLKNAKLVGGASSFQLATFEDADLSGALLSGSLQGISLKNASCTGATINGSFQGANIDGAKFPGADLSSLGANDLASCYFDTPPTFDRTTKFPAGFDPAQAGWMLEESPAR